MEYKNCPPGKQTRTVVGKNIKMVDCLPKVTGQAQFVDDLRLPGMLHARILRSPIAHGVIKSIDIESAKRVPGVYSVLTHTDVPQKRVNSSNRFPKDWTFLPQDRYLLENKVRYIGDRVAAVAAESEQALTEALGKIMVEYSVLPPAIDVLEAIKPDAPLVHEYLENNIVRHIKFGQGDIDEGFKQADYFFENRYHVGPVQHGLLEPHSCIAHWQGDSLTIWTATQVPFMIRQLVAEIFNLPIGNVRIIRPYVGGAMGGKDEMFEEALAALLSQKTHRPVKLIFNREEEFYSNRRHPAVLDLKTGVTKDGQIVARSLTAYVDTGAYGSCGPKIANAMGDKWAALYPTPHFQYDGYVVYTNTVPSGALRGYGNPQSNFAQESQLDEIAEKLGMDPIELRLKNCIKPGDVHPVQKFVMGSSGLKECMERAMEKVDWESRGTYHSKPSNSDIRRGVGMACALHGSSLAPIGPDMGTASMRLNEDGTINLSLGSSDTGQGANTVLSQMAAEVLGVPISYIKVYSADTELSPIDVGNCASRTTFVVGNAVCVTAKRFRIDLLEYAAEKMDESIDDLTIKDGVVQSKLGQVISLKELAQYIRYTKCKTVDITDSWAASHPAPPFASTFAEVEVDTRTGQVQVTKLVSSQDVGFAINPMMVEGQMHGAMQLGLGLALNETIILDKRDGLILNPSYLEYGIAGSTEMPPIETIIVESNEPDGPFGAKSVGEVGSVPVAAAVANAVYQATGVRIRSLPITPERILDGIEKLMSDE